LAGHAKEMTDKHATSMENVLADGVIVMCAAVIRRHARRLLIQIGVLAVMERRREQLKVLRQAVVLEEIRLQVSRALEI
jgi:hypothetical protein